MNVEQIASVCHEANKGLSMALGDFYHHTWKAAADWQKQSAIHGVEFHLANPDADDSASHTSWAAEKVLDGWVWGDVKDAAKKTHPCLVPFEELPPEQQAKDTLFRAVVHVLKPLLVE